MHPYKRAAVGRRLALGEPEVVDGSLRLSLLASEVEDLMAGNLTIGFDPEQVRIIEVTGSSATSDYMVFSHVEDGQLRIAFAGAASQDYGQGSILEIAVEPIGGVQVFPLLAIEGASINGGLAPVEVVDSPAALALPQTFALQQNWPNPFNPETQVRYSLDADSDVRLTIFDMTGQTIATLVSEHQVQGSYTVAWDARNDAGQGVASGVYFYRLDAGSNSLTRKMSLLR